METNCKWKERETSRFADGTYKPVPVSLPYPPSHYVHLSTVDTENDYVAYTPSDAYGEANRQVRLKFGRYLHKTFSGLTDVEVQSFVSQLKSALAIMDKPVTLNFATDIETINRIFETCMHACGSTYTSCMHGKWDGDTIRPYHVYANSPDVAVAYVTTGDGAIVSRSVVSTKNKVWVRCYSIATGENDSDCETLRALLAEAGYTKGELEGNRLTKLSIKPVMLPYLDNDGRHVRDDGKYWVVVSDGDGDFECSHTDGTAKPSRTCEHCGCREDDCECYICECCQTLNTDGCENCSMCEQCDRCTTHGICTCDRCSECHLLTEDCECEDEETETETTPDAVVPLEIELPVTPQQIRDKLCRIFSYLYTTYGWDNVESEYQLLRRVLYCHDRSIRRVVLTIQNEEGIVV